jgi:hypothetical protein
MFIIAIFFIALITMFGLTAALNSYNQKVLERNKMDWERTSEHVTFVAAEVGADGKLNVTFFNDGGVTLHLVQVWLSEFPNSSYIGSTWQRQYWISRYVSSGETVNDLGYYSELRKVTRNSMGDLTPLSGLSNSLYYKIKLVTDRGNVFECQIPYPPEAGDGGGAAGGYVLQIDNDNDNFQYAYGRNSSWTRAFAKPGTPSPTMYRILLRNTTGRDIVILSSTIMLQMYGAVGNVVLWYVVDPPNDPSGQSYLPLNPTLWRPKDTPPPPVYPTNPPVDVPKYIVPAGGQQYVYFAASTERGSGWQEDPSASSKQYVLVSCVLYFNYVGDPELRTVPTPAIVQVLNP